MISPDTKKGSRSPDKVKSAALEGESPVIEEDSDGILSPEYPVSQSRGQKAVIMLIFLD